MPQTKLLVDHKPSMANSRGERVFSAMFGFLPKLLSVRLWAMCLTTHTVYMMDTHVHVRLLLLICFYMLVLVLQSEK